MTPQQALRSSRLPCADDAKPTKDNHKRKLGAIGPHISPLYSHNPDDDATDSWLPSPAWRVTVQGSHAPVAPQPAPPQNQNLIWSAKDLNARQKCAQGGRISFFRANARMPPSIRPHVSDPNGFANSALSHGTTRTLDSASMEIGIGYIPYDTMRSCPRGGRASAIHAPEEGARPTHSPGPRTPRASLSPSTNQCPRPSSAHNRRWGRRSPQRRTTATLRRHGGRNPP